MTKSKLLRLFKEIKHDGAVVALYDIYSVKKSELELVVADSNKLENVDPSTRVIKELFMEDIIRMFENDVRYYDTIRNLAICGFSIFG